MHISMVLKRDGRQCTAHMLGERNSAGQKDLHFCNLPLGRWHSAVLALSYIQLRQLSTYSLGAEGLGS